jgi:putative multiple sugar transport system permease protein
MSDFGRSRTASKFAGIAKKNTMFLALILVIVLFEMLLRATGNGTLFIPSNISNIISQNAYVVILATGMLLCILSGGNIDLSVGAVVVFVGAVAGQLIVNLGLNIYLSAFLCLLVGLAVGAWHGFWIAYVRIPAFIVTLAGMMLWRGVAWIILDGLTISPFPENYLAVFSGFLPMSDNKDLVSAVTMAVAAVVCVLFVVIQLVGRHVKKKKNYAVEDKATLVGKCALVCIVVLGVFYFLGQYKGIPIVLIMLAVIVGAYRYYTARTVPGRHLYALGGNEKAAKLSGVNTNKILFISYANMGFLAAFTALVCVGRFSSAFPALGNQYEMDAIASCYIGGASAYGGTGTVFGALVGAIFMGVLNNGMSLMHVDQNWQMPIKGTVLLIAVAFDVISKKRGRAS